MLGNGVQGHSQAQNLEGGGGGGQNFVWKNKISEVDFLYFYGN